jgi:hypothetical protein
MDRKAFLEMSGFEFSREIPAEIEADFVVHGNVITTHIYIQKKSGIKSAIVIMTDGEILSIPAHEVAYQKSLSE